MVPGAGEGLVGRTGDYHCLVAGVEWVELLRCLVPGVIEEGPED